MSIVVIFVEIFVVPFIVAVVCLHGVQEEGKPSKEPSNRPWILASKDGWAEKGFIISSLPERLYRLPRTMTLWSRKTKNPEVSTGPLAYLLAHLLARTAQLLACSLTPKCAKKLMINWLFLLCFLLFWTIVHESIWRLKEKTSRAEIVWVLVFLDAFSHL